MPRKSDTYIENDALESPTATVEESGAANGDEEEEVSDGMVIDLITGETIKLNEKESIRQEEERRLLEEFGYEALEPGKRRDLIRRDMGLKGTQSNKKKKFPLVVLREQRPGQKAVDASRIYILFDIQLKKKAEDTKFGSEALAEQLRDIPGAEYGVWTNGTDRVVYFKR
jgi:hypothetical protein